jgi:hypothetical protein
MRTTVTLEDRLARALRRRAAESGRTFQAELNEAVERGLEPRGPRQPFELRTYSLGGARPGVNLDKSLALSDAAEESELARKMAGRK